MWVPEADDAESPEQQEQVPLDRVLRIVETVYGQRQDKEHNPHGEHAHDVWQVRGAGLTTENRLRKRVAAVHNGQVSRWLRTSQHHRSAFGGATLPAHSCIAS